jgi:UDP-glucose 4-epimerase
MKKILVTGGCGFIGSNLIAYLLNHNLAQVRVLDNQSLGKQEYISDLDVDFIEGDIRSINDIQKAMTDVDGVVHLAADTRVIDSIENPTHNFETNVIGTFNVLKVARDLGIQSLVNASTAGAILGDVKPPVHEEILPKPIAPYGASKLATEGYCSAFAGAYNLNVVSVRFTNVYGERSYHKGSVVAHFLKRILSGQELTIYGDGSQLRDYIYVKDLCHGIYQCLMQASGLRGEVFQLGTGIPTSVNELVSLIRETVGKRYPFSVNYDNFRQGEIKEVYTDISKARTMLGFEPEMSLKKGLEQTWQWFINEKSIQ